MKMRKIVLIVLDCIIVFVIFVMLIIHIFNNKVELGSNDYLHYMEECIRD